VLISDVNCKDVSLMVDYLLWIVTSVQKSLLVDYLLWIVTSRIKESFGVWLVFFPPPHTQKVFWGEAKKVIGQKARFSLEKREKTFIFRQPTL